MKASSALTPGGAYVTEHTDAYKKDIFIILMRVFYISMSYSTVRPYYILCMTSRVCSIRLEAPRL